MNFAYPMTEIPVRNILFITWDSPETRYLERLFLPIFTGLRARGYRFHVLQFSWGSEEITEARGALCAKSDIPYRKITIVRRLGAAGPFSSAVLGARAIKLAVSEWQIDTLMPRSLMPALAVLRMRKSAQDNLNIVFDADGLAADERVDFGGLSPHSLTYRFLREIEGALLRRSDVVLTRTESARSILLARAGSALKPKNCHVVSNGVDAGPFTDALKHFPKTTKELFTLCYCGSIGAQYRLPEMLDIAKKIKTKIPEFQFRLFSQYQDVVQNALKDKGLHEENWINCKAVPSDKVPDELAQCDLGIALRKPSFSTQAILPIKLGEYLLAGLPVIGTTGVGNTDQLSDFGVFRSTEADELEETLKWIVDEVLPNRALMREKSHAAGRKYFSLESTVDSYETALFSIAKQSELFDGQGHKMADQPIANER
jgi:glycosyltransferase involved in cell wall biosynthesis